MIGRKPVNGETASGECVKNCRTGTDWCALVDRV